ncbi:MAG: hypothetical protein A2X46_11500 [Lentisphaerae bacterium GWF2_57_35]|nr:MAG: hypothetical protein A2X46_11500 [Lentisphaerae bacterium GWF2_57_35]
MHSNRFLDLDWTIQQFIDRVPKGYFLYGKLVGCSHCRGDFYTLLYHSALNGHEELTRIMVNFGASIEYRDDEGVDLLIAAMGSRDLAIVEYVITSGANVNADHFMYPAIHLAIMPPYSPEMINLLLDHGADINSTNESGWTPLDMACIWNTNAIPDLIKLGAKLGEHKKRPLIGQGEDVAQKLRTMHNNALNDTGDSLRGSPSR